MTHKNIYIENLSQDPYYNLAFEQAVVDFAAAASSVHAATASGNNYFMLWQNKSAIIVGKHQNTIEEINEAFVKEHNIAVVRRLSGGGAVYHDLGNLNFGFVVNTGIEQPNDFAYFCKPIKEALLSFGVPVEIQGRNDMTVNGKKFSGNAQYKKGSIIMHHGTILYDSDLDMLSKALKTPHKADSKAIKSKESRVTNIRPFMKTDTDINGFCSMLKEYLCKALNMEEIIVQQTYHDMAQGLKENVYSRWSWNYGSSPPHTVRKIKTIPGCGKIEVFLDIGKEGIIRDISFFGDFFGYSDPGLLKSFFIGQMFEIKAINKQLENIDLTQFFHGIEEESFFSLLFE